MKIIYKQNITDQDKEKPDIKCISTDAMNENFGRIGDFEYLPKDLIIPEKKNRVCQVFWSKPYKLDFKNARWNISNQFELTLPLCALSLALLKEMNQEVVLYTDSEGQELLKDLGYDRIYNIFDKLNVSNDFWACGKILALQNEPLDSILVDTDIFIYDGTVLDKAYQLDVFGSHRENTDVYKEILKFGSIFFEHLQGNFDFSTNTGFMKINNLYKKNQFISAYWAGLKHFSNPKFLQEFKEKGKGAYCADLLIEQFNFHKLCDPETLITLPEKQKDVQGFIHLVSFEKYLKIPIVLDILKKRYPQMYNKVITKWKEFDFSVCLEDYQYDLI